MQHPDEGTIHAWLDGELPADKAERVAVHASECPECGALVAEARGLIAASTWILTALDNVPAGVTSSGSAVSDKPTVVGRPARRRHWYDRTDLRAAAAVLFVAGASLVAVRFGRNPGASFQTAAKMNRSPSAVAPLQDTGAPAAAEAAQQNRVSEMNAVVGGMTGAAERRRSKNDVAASPPAVSSKVTARSPVPALGIVRAMDEARSSSAAATPLRVLNVDSTATIRRVVYQVSPGIEVTLVESLVDAAPESDLTANRSAMQEKTPDSGVTGRLSGVTLQSAAKADGKAAPMAMSVTPRPPINTILWRDLNRRYTLSGPLTPSELEAIKARLMKMRR